MLRDRDVAAIEKYDWPLILLLIVLSTPNWTYWLVIDLYRIVLAFSSQRYRQENRRITAKVKKNI